jgi:hypothetical protein
MAKFKIKRRPLPLPPREPLTIEPIAPVCFLQIQRADTTVKHAWYDMMNDGKRVEFESVDMARDAMFRLFAASSALRYRLVQLHEEA